MSSVEKVYILYIYIYIYIYIYMYICTNIRKPEENTVHDAGPLCIARIKLKLVIHTKANA